jgi:hypothetical protein
MTSTAYAYIGGIVNIKDAFSGRKGASDGKIIPPTP